MKRTHFILLAVIAPLATQTALAQDRPASPPAGAQEVRAKDCIKPLAQRHFHGAERNYPISASRSNAPCEPAKQEIKKPLHDHRQVHNK